MSPKFITKAQFTLRNRETKKSNKKEKVVEHKQLGQFRVTNSLCGKNDHCDTNVIFKQNVSWL